MNVKLTILNFCLLLLAVSCSMDDDVLNDMGNNNSGNMAVEMGETALSFKVDLVSAVATRSLSDGGALEASSKETEINSCTLILLNGDQVISVMEGLFVNEDQFIVDKANGTEDDLAKMIVKVKKPSPYSVVVIANSNESFSGCEERDDIAAVIQHDKDALVKMGDWKIDFSDDFAGYASTAEALRNPLKLGAIGLRQLTARIELAEFNVKGFTGSSVPENVSVSGVDVLHLNPESFTTTAQTHRAAVYGPESKSYENPVKVFDAATQKTSATYSFVDHENLLFFYSFRNLEADNDKRLAVQVRFKVGDKERTTCAFVINKAGDTFRGLHSGYVYRLALNMTIKGNEVLTDVVCYTNDWVNNKISIPMEETN